MALANRYSVCAVMPSSLGSDLQATVTRYTLARLQRAQLLIPIALIVTTLARRLPGIWTAGMALCILVAIGLLLRSAIERKGLLTVRVENDGVWIGSGDICVPRSAVQRWTFFKGIATLLCDGTSYRLRSKRGQDSELEACLQSLLGAPTRLQRRGSPKARWIAGGIMVCGLVAVPTGIALESMPLAVIGVPAMLIGFGVFAALSSRHAVA
jgi:hypothetical protein